MKIYLVASNTETTYLVKAMNKKEAIGMVKADHYYTQGEYRKDFVAYEINDYMKDDYILPL